MSLKVHVGVYRRCETRAASVWLELELDADPAGAPDRCRAHLRQLFALANAALAEYLRGDPPPAPAGAARPPLRVFPPAAEL
jgi:hypothetical protein